jgi:signal transduction histidine kinase
MIVIVQNTFSNYGFSSISTIQWILIGSGFLTFIFLEIVEGVAYPKKPYFLLAILLTGIRIIVFYLIYISEPTGISSSIIGYILYTLCFYISPIIVFPLLLLVLYVFYQDIRLIWQRSDFHIGYLFAVVIRLDDRTRQQNQIMVNQLEQYAANSISLGKQEERNRISRDLHDSLGHQLVAVNIQLQKAVAYRDINVDESFESINKAQQATNDAIKELRQTIKDLREYESQTNLEEDLKKIVQNVRENGLEIDYDFTGNPNGYPEFTLLTLKQIVQESLTNIEKHANASLASLKISASRKKIIIKIEDNGVGFNPKNLQKEGHYGLLGVEERLNMVGGRMKIKSKSNVGTKLLFELPKDIYG